MDNDDRMVGQILSRREALAALAGAGAATVLAGCAPTFLQEMDLTDEAMLPRSTGQGSSDSLPSCVVRPELTEGPFFLDERLDRNDIRADLLTGQTKPGVILILSFRVSAVGSGVCLPLEGVFVDVWHCDASGLYSGVQGAGSDTTGESFLRGYQETDSDGLANFTTVYPGWYPGRAVHIHFKVRSELSPASSYEFTSQLFFEEAQTDLVHARDPYSVRGTRTVRNDQDGIFRLGGSQLTLSLQDGPDEYSTLFDLGLQLS